MTQEAKNILNCEIKVSVIVLAYNSERTIGVALDSILAQECDFNYEIIIGDDGSTDGTAEICERYRLAYPDKIHVLHSATNKGLLANYYECVLNCRGEYIADLAADDRWIDPHKLSRQADFLDTHPDVELVHTNWYYLFSETGETVSPWGGGNLYPYKKSAAPMELVPVLLSHPGKPVVHLCSAMFRRETFAEIYTENEELFTDPQFMVEDLQLITILASKGRVEFLEEPTLLYSVHSQSMSGTDNPGKLFDLYYGSTLLTRRLQHALDIPQKTLAPTYRRLCSFVLSQAFHSKDKERRRKAIALFKECGIRMSLQCRLMSVASSNKILWTLSRQLLQFLRN